MGHGPGEFVLLPLMAGIAELGPFLFHQTLIWTGMGVMTRPADPFFVLEMVKRLLEHVLFFFMARET
jgi:hypothetical protein